MKKIDQKKDELIKKLKNDLIVYAKGYKVESWFTEEEVKLLFSALQQQESEPEKSAEEIINGLGNIITGIQSDIDFNEKTNLGLIMDGLTVILEQVEEYAQFKSVPGKGVIVNN